MVGTEARRVETEEANDARLESFRPIATPERFLSRRSISTERPGQQNNCDREGDGLSRGVVGWKLGA